MVHIAEVIFWKYGPVAATVEGKITYWGHPTIPQPDEVQLAADREEYIAFMAANLYKEKRAAEYPPAGDQLGEIWKAINALAQATGTQLPKESADMLGAIEIIKEKYPQPETKS